MAKHPVIVLEGPDGTGKTTLGHALADYMGGHYMHLTYRFPKAMNLYHIAALEMVLEKAEEQPVILDRWWLSELVYAYVYRGQTAWPAVHRMLQRVALQHNFLYIMCNLQNSTQYNDHFKLLKTQREEMYDEGHMRVWHAFNHGRALLGNYESYDFKTLTRSHKPAQRLAELAWDINAHTGLVGSRAVSGSSNPTVVVLSSEQGNFRREMWPGFTTDNTKLINFQRVFINAGIPEDNLAWIDPARVSESELANLFDGVAYRYDNDPVHVLALDKTAFGEAESKGLFVRHYAEDVRELNQIIHTYLKGSTYDHLKSVASYLCLD